MEGVEGSAVGCRHLAAGLCDEHGAAWSQILVLGLIFACLGALSDGTWALVAGTLGERLRRSPRFPAVQRYVSGTVFVGLGAVAALTAPVKQQ